MLHILVGVVALIVVISSICSGGEEVEEAPPTPAPTPVVQATPVHCPNGSADSRADSCAYDGSQTYGSNSHGDPGAYPDGNARSPLLAPGLRRPPTRSIAGYRLRRLCR